MSIGSRLLQYRLEKKLTQQEVADYLKVARQTVSKWENEKTIPPLDTLQALCEFYEISLTDVMDSKIEYKGSVQTTYVEIQKILEKIQKQNKKKQSLSFLLMFLCTVSLSSSIYVYQQFQTYQKNLYNDLAVDPYKDESLEIIYEDHSIFSNSETNPSNIRVNHIDINNKNVNILGQLIVKEYTYDTNCELVLDSMEYGKIIYPLTKENERTFVFDLSIPLTNYHSAHLRISDGNGKEVLEQLNQDYLGLFNFCNTIIEKTTSIYMPIENEKLKLDTLIYEPIQLDWIEGSFQEGTVYLRVYDYTAKKTLYNDSFPITQYKEIQLTLPTSYGNRIQGEVNIHLKGEFKTTYCFGFVRNIHQHTKPIVILPLIFEGGNES